MAKILLADNVPEELREWAAVLRGEGYEVVEASSVQAAKDILDQREVDLAVLDLHLERVDDSSDESGLRLAQAYRASRPIIMLTGLPTIDAAIEALQRDGRSAPAVAFVRKQQDGPRALLRAVRQAIVPKVFVSHGQDDRATAEVVKFLEDGGAHAVVLREQAVASQTILEVFEKHAHVQFAVILVTPDDEGARKGEKLQPRARQNVIFELGFFLAKLGRNRVVALCKREGEPIELPSNYHGVLYREMDPGGGWCLKIARDMKEAGIELNLV